MKVYGNALVLLSHPFTHLLHFGAASVFQPQVAESISDQPTERQARLSRRLFESLEELARIVDISYCVGTSGVQKPFQCPSRCREFEGFELITTWNTGPLLSDSCGYIALSHAPFPKRIIVSFRGTYSITNTIIDLSAYPQQYVPYISDGDDHGAKCSNCTVHAGFMTSWQNARATILSHVAKAREQYTDYDVVLVGHSLGGAVAALAGLEMHLRGWEPQVTTFGEPKVGNAAFVRFLDDSFGLTNTGNSSYSEVDAETRDEDRSSGRDLRFRRVTHVNDPVPLLPLDEWGYRTHAGEIFISKLHLPPSPDDLEQCDGDHDPRCIAGAEVRVMLDRLVLDGLHSAESIHSIQDKQHGQQVVLSGNRVSDNGEDYRHHAPETSVEASWSLIPDRFRLWELFFAHRDYFWRLGLCVPGGDPTRIRDAGQEFEY